MTRLGDAQTHYNRGVVRKASFTWPVQVRAAFNATVQPATDMDVVVEVAQTGAPDPAVRLIATRPKLVRGTQTDALELVVQIVLPPEKARQRRIVPPRHRVVIAGEHEPLAQRRGQLAQTGKHRRNERLLARDLMVASIARRDIDTDERDLPRLRVEDNRSRPTRQRHPHLLGKVVDEPDPACEENTAFACVTRVTHPKTGRAEPFGEEVGAGATARLSKHDDVVRTRAKPAKNGTRARRGGRADVEGQQGQRGSDRSPLCPTRLSTQVRRRAFGLDQHCHRTMQRRAWPVVPIGTPQAFAGLLRIPTGPDGL